MCSPLPSLFLSFPLTSYLFLSLIPLSPSPSLPPSHLPLSYRVSLFVTLSIISQITFRFPAFDPDLFHLTLWQSFRSCRLALRNPDGNQEQRRRKKRKNLASFSFYAQVFGFQLIETRLSQFYYVTVVVCVCGGGYVCIHVSAYMCVLVCTIVEARSWH